MRLLTPDICVIGAGSAGLTVAAAARAFGVEVVLVEEGRMGGDCLNTGCVPSKALIAAAAHARAVAEAPRFGVDAGPARVDFAKVRDHVRSVIAGIAPHDSVERFEGLGATVITARARFTDPDTVVAGDATIRARRFVVATGSRALVPTIPGLDTVSHLTNETVFDLDRLPGHLLVVGGGPIGLELAQAFRRLGSEVTVVEHGAILPKDDPELVAVVRARLAAEGVTLVEGARLTRLAPAAEGLTALAASEGAERSVAATHLLLATGRTANVEDLGLEAAGIFADRRGIRTDRGLRTDNRRVYAIGDVVAGSYRFTHWAGYHAGLAVRSILFRLPVKENPDILPWCTYTDPEIGRVGLTEEAARERHGGRVKVLAAPYSANDRARTGLRTDGMVKLVVGPRGRILGAAAAGPEAGELLGLLALAVSRRLTVKALADTVFPYPTLAEIARRAALAYYGDSLANPWIGRLLGLLRRLG